MWRETNTMHSMSIKRILFGLPLAAAFSSHPVLATDDAEALAGKWSVKKVSEQGQAYTQTITIKKDKFVFQILGGEGRVFLHAEGDLKLEKVGPFSAVHFLQDSRWRVRLRPPRRGRRVRLHLPVGGGHLDGSRKF